MKEQNYCKISSCASENSTDNHQILENFYQENKEVYEKLIASKDEQIEFLKGLLGKK